MIKRMIVTDEFSKEILHFNEVQECRKVNILFGGNGAGKTTFLNALRPEKVNPFAEGMGMKPKPPKIRCGLDGRPTICMYFSNKENNYARSSNLHKASEEITMADGDFELGVGLVKQRFDAQMMSEGESLMYSIADFKWCVDHLEDDMDYVILIDEIDSGLDAENAHLLGEWVHDAAQRISNAQFFVAFNNYTFLKAFLGEEVILNMYTGQYERMEWDSFESFYNSLIGWKKIYPRDYLNRNNNEEDE